jgi:hypothetical protein
VSSSRVKVDGADPKVRGFRLQLPPVVAALRDVASAVPVAWFWKSVCSRVIWARAGMAAAGAAARNAERPWVFMDG